MKESFIILSLLLSFSTAQDNTVHFGTGTDGDLYVGSNETYYTDENRHLFRYQNEQYCLVLLKTIIINLI
jgi:hypothetical protein